MLKTQNTLKTRQQQGKYHYQQPRIYLLGSLEKIQAYYDGTWHDGPDSSYWYDG